jgi:hypothetical protein
MARITDTAISLELLTCVVAQLVPRWGIWDFIYSSHDLSPKAQNSLSLYELV